MSDLRSRLKKLAEKFFNQAARPSATRKESDAFASCAADLRALLAEPQSQRVKMEPQPPAGWSGLVWDHDKADQWSCWGEKRPGVLGRAIRIAPSPAHRPVCDEEGNWGAKGDWWWEVQP